MDLQNIALGVITVILVVIAITLFQIKNALHTIRDGNALALIYETLLDTHERLVEIREFVVAIEEETSR